MLVAHVPHSEQCCRNQRDYNDDHDSLQVHGISDMRSLAGDRSRHTKECVECVNAGMKESKFAAPFEKARLSCIF